MLDTGSTGQLALKVTLSKIRWAKGWAVSLRLAELKRADVPYEELATRLAKYGFKETKASIANKFTRATITAAFLMACLVALGRDGVKLEDI